MEKLLGKYYAVIGANYGDEGKGLVTNWLCKRAYDEHKRVLNILTNGGCQRGHTAYDKHGNRHIYSHFGAGYDYADIFFCKYYMINPMIFMQEYDELSHQLDQINTIYVDPNCTLTTPYDMLVNRLLELSRDEKHGSCGYGIWETFCRNKVNPIYWKDVVSKSHLELFIMLKGLRITYFDELLLRYGLNLNKDEEELFCSDELIHNYVDDLRIMTRYCQTIDFEELVKDYDMVVFENAQGLLLDMDVDRWGTPSKTGMTYIREMLQDKSVQPFYVTRSYLTKHGNGHLPNECSKNDLNPEIIDRTNIQNTYQGSLRYAPFTKKSVQELIDRIKTDAKGYDYKVVVTHANEYWNNDLAFADYLSFNETELVS